MKFATIVLARSDIYKNICETFWDLIDENWATPSIFEAIRSPEQLRQALIEGQTAMLMGPAFMEMESLEDAQTPFILIVTEGEKVWATINGADISW